VFDGEPVPDANDCLWCEGSFNSGAAVLGGLMGMAEAIRRIESVRGCSTCGKASSYRSWPTLNRPGGRLFSAGWVCYDCERAADGGERR